ncbi:MAG: M48 family metalloprotease [Saprospiraceae bacterium]|nr:M48 family metalloprotease [Saprospiraceae bacterium]
MLKNSRDHESQSDELGVLYSTQIGYDAKQMANFFQTISRLSGGPEKSIPDFLSTHPDPLNRYERVNQLAIKAQSKVANSTSEFKINRDPYLRMIEGLTYGDDPRQGYVENNVFYHPELKFQYPIPSAWKVNNTPQQVQIAPENGEAIIILTLAQGTTLEEAASKIVEQFQLTVESRNNTTVNNFPAMVLKTKQVNPQTNATIDLLSYLIRDGDLIYVFHGITTPEKYPIYRPTFENTMTNFRRFNGSKQN